MAVPILIETLISMIVLYILFSIINSLIIEGFARWFKTRAIFLKNTLLRLFGSDADIPRDPDENKPVEKAAGEMKSAFSFIPKLLKSEAKDTRSSFVDLIYQHALLKKLSAFDKGKISSIDGGLFADIVISIVTKDQGIQSKEQLQAAVNANTALTPEMKEIFAQVIVQIDEAKGEIFKQFRGHVLRWYEFYMDKATESYKNHIRKFLFIGGVVLATVLNLDTIYLTRWFYQNPDARASFVDLGEQMAKDSLIINAEELTKYLVAHKDSLDGNGILRNLLTHASGKTDTTIKYAVVSPIPIGPSTLRYRPVMNSSFSAECGYWFLKFIGILITALALSFGSPFWFDLLKKVISARDQLKVLKSNG